MKSIYLWVNFCFTIIGAPIVLILFGIDQNRVSKETAFLSLIIWIYFLCGFLVIRKDLITKNEKTKIIKDFLTWRLKKPHSDYQTSDYDIQEFLKGNN
jgi:hypothetical protein